MDWSIHFDDQTRLVGIKIHDETINGVLAAKSGAQLFPAQALPQDILCFCRFLAHFAGQGLQIFPDSGRGLPSSHAPHRRRAGGGVGGGIAILHKQRNRHTLADVEDVFVWAAVGRRLALQTVAVQIQNVDFIKRLEQALAHAAKGGVIQVAVIGDHRHDATPRLVYLPLRKAQKLYVVILQPFGVLLAERLAIHGVVTLRAINISFEQLLGLPVPVC